MLRVTHLHSNLVICVSGSGDAMGYWIHDVDFEEISRSCIGIIEGLFLALQPAGRLIGYLDIGCHGFG